MSTYGATLGEYRGGTATLIPEAGDGTPTPDTDGLIAFTVESVLDVDDATMPFARGSFAVARLGLVLSAGAMFGAGLAGWSEGLYLAGVSTAGFGSITLTAGLRLFSGGRL